MGQGNTDRTLVHFFETVEIHTLNGIKLNSIVVRPMTGSFIV